MIKPFTKQESIKVLRFTIGAILAILIAESLQLNYAMSTGIITLLTIQDTKKETVVVSLKRITIFALMTFFSLIILPTVGYNVWGFAVILVPYLCCCLLFSMKEAIAPIAVLCTHYISAKSCSLSMIRNEFLILFIGAGIGIIINLFMSNHLDKIRAKQQNIDSSFRRILARMSVYILKENKADYTGECFRELDALLDSLKTESLQYMNNHFIGTNDYFYTYVQMRLSQCALLKQIYQDIITLDAVPNQTVLLSGLLKQISEEFAEINDAIGLLAAIEELQAKLETEPMPRSRKEFENRAVLYHVLMDLKLFLGLKKHFAETVSEEDKRKYWKTDAIC